jgi:hypothetical protein
MKKILLSLVAIMIAATSYANGPKLGPNLPVKDDVKGMTFGVQHTNGTWQLTYVNNGDPGLGFVRVEDKVPDAEKYFGGLAKNAKIVTVLTTPSSKPGSKMEISLGVLTPVLKTRVPLLNIPVQVDAGFALPGVGGNALNDLRVARQGQLLLSLKANL